MDKSAILDIKQFDQSESQQEVFISTLTDHLLHNHHVISAPHKHNFYMTVLFTKGTGYHEIDFERFEVVRGSTFMLNPGQAHFWMLSDDIEGFIFFHSENFYSLNFAKNTLSSYPFFYSTQNSPYLLLNENETLKQSRVFEELLSESKFSFIYKYRKINNLIDGIYIDLARLYMEQHQEVIHRSNRFSDKLSQLETLVDENYKKEKSPAQYAAWMNMSTKHLNRIIQNSLAKTTTILITERILLEAKKLLSHSSFSLSEIAEELGYEEYAYFSRLFKKHTGETPLEFRSKYTTAI